MLRKSAKIEIFHSLLYLMVFINKYTLLSFPFTSVVHPGYICWYIVLILWSITLMVKSYDDYVSSSSLLSDCSQLIVSNGFYQWIYINEFPIHIWCLLSIWLIYCYYALMINKCGICYLRTGCKKLLGRLINVVYAPPNDGTGTEPNTSLCINSKISLPL